MAIATAVVNGETITFDTEVRDSILAELLSFHLSQGGIEIEHNRHYTSGEV